MHLHSNHEEAVTRLILHSCEAASEGYERLVLRCSDTDVLVLLLYFMPTRVAEVWMVSGASTQSKCYPVHTLSNQLSQSVRENPLSFHALIGCDTVSPFSGYGKKKCWKIFQKQPDSVSSIGRNGELDLIEQFVCRLYGVPTQTDVNQARLHFVYQRKERIGHAASNQGCPRSPLQASKQPSTHLAASRSRTDIVPLPTDTFAWAKETSICYHLSGQDYPQFQKPVFS